MATLKREGNELVLHLTIWEKLGALHKSPRAPIGAVEKIEYEDQLWGSQTLRGVRAPGTALPFVVLLGTLRGRGFRDFVAIKGRRPGVVLTLNSGKFSRWIFTLQQSRDDVEKFSA